MSSTAAQLVRSRLSPFLDGSALERARRRAGLSVVPERRRAESRLPFVVLVSMLLVGGVVGLLLFNTSMQQAAFSESRLQEQATNLAARQQTLSLEIQRMQDPQAIAQKAQRLGMVYPGVPAFLDVPSGKVEGVPTPANRDATPPLYPRITKPRAARLADSELQTRAHADARTGNSATDTPSSDTAGRRTTR